MSSTLTKGTSPAVLSSARKALEYIQAADFATTDLSTNALLTLTGLTHDSFNRGFKTLTGMKPQDYIGQLKIEKAKFLLADEEMSVIDVSRAIGFSSSSGFCHTFKKFTGQTPYEFRQTLQPVFESEKVERLERAKSLLMNPRLRIADIWSQAGYTGEHHFCREFSSAIAMTPQDFRRKNEISKTLIDHSTKIERLINRIQSCEIPPEDYTLEKLAGHAGLSDTVFREAFKEYTGKPPIQYISDNWPERVKRKLASGERNMDILARFGLCDTADELQRKFKSTVGIGIDAYIMIVLPIRKDRRLHA